MSRRIILVVYLSVLAFAGIFPWLAANAQDAGSASTLQAELNKQYKHDLVLVVLKDGITGVAPAMLVTCASTFKDGALKPPGGMCLMATNGNSHAITNGTKVHPAGVIVNLKNEKVTVNFVECDSCNGAQVPSSFKSQVNFIFPKGYLESAEPDQVQEVIAQVLGPDNGDQGGGGDAQQQQGGGDQGGGQAPQQNAAPAQAPAEITLGQTVDQVQASFGPPDKIVNLGPKQIYVYKDLKVTFINGKVVNVQ